MKLGDWIMDDLTYIQATRIYDRYPRQRVTIYAPDKKTALMGHVPHNPEAPDIHRILKPECCWMGSS